MAHPAVVAVQVQTAVVAWMGTAVAAARVVEAETRAVVGRVHWAKVARALVMGAPAGEHAGRPQAAM